MSSNKSDPHIKLLFFLPGTDVKQTTAYLFDNSYCPFFFIHNNSKTIPNYTIYSFTSYFVSVLKYILEVKTFRCTNTLLKSKLTIIVVKHYCIYIELIQVWFT